LFEIERSFTKRKRAAFDELPSLKNKQKRRLGLDIQAKKQRAKSQVRGKQTEA
jgi:hypothetical protein